MTGDDQKPPAATPAHLLLAFLILLIFFAPFVVKFGFGNEPWVEALFGKNRVFVFWAISFGAVIYGGYWSDRHPDKIPSWWKKPLG